MLLDNDGGKGERRMARVARAPLGYEEFAEKLDRVNTLFQKHKQDAWNSFDRMIFPFTELGELCLTAGLRLRELPPPKDEECQEE